MQHTPGPWKHVGLPGGWDGVTSERDGLICKLVFNNPANASLIAEAPALKARVAELEAGINELLDSGRFYRSAFEFDFSIDGEEIGAKLKALAGRKDG